MRKVYRYRLVITGVGGQGILLLSEVIGRAAIMADLDIRMGEVHGMAQRGGSVMTTINIGEVSYSPLVKEGGADCILGLEPLETLRCLKYLKKDGIVLYSIDTVVPPLPVLLQQESYPSLEEIRSKLLQRTKHVYSINGGRLAKEAGSVITLNSVMLGAFSVLGNVAIGRKVFRDALKERVPPKFVDINLRAFDLGVREAEELRGAATKA